MRIVIHSNKLSRREQQVADKIMLGLPNKAIADQLFITERTVKFHCANIYRKLHISNRTSLISVLLQEMAR